MLFAKAFPHRYNPDGSYDSICTACLKTVARAWNENELSSPESAHICDPARIRRIASYACVFEPLGV